MSSKNFFKLQNSKNTVFNKERVERERNKKDRKIPWRHTKTSIMTPLIPL
jgi:hypothetical protein